MEILDPSHIREWDKFTIDNEPITSLALMERAAEKCVDWILTNGFRGRKFSIFCGKGNNGGDGLAIARLLIQANHSVNTYIIEHGQKGTEDFQANLVKLHAVTTHISFISLEDSIHQIPVEEIIIDAIFGSGLNKSVFGIERTLIDHLNASGNEIISIDIPSGIYIDSATTSPSTIHASHTLSFQCFKKAFLIAENSKFIGTLHILPIGLHPSYLNRLNCPDRFIDSVYLKSFFKKRDGFSHKGNFGHAALFAGSVGMIGAACLAAGACMRSGVGKLSCFIPEIGYEILQVSVPEAMCVISGQMHLGDFENVRNFSALAIGPGIGIYPGFDAMLKKLFIDFNQPIIIDADALNVLAAHPDLVEQIPKGSIITPHPGEFDRLFGKCNNGFERIEKARQQANALDIVIVLKGKYSCVAVPSGTCYFNPTGNSGMSKAGNGDVLTGMILGILAQGYSSEQAAILAVYLHGLAADLAIEKESMESLLPTDSIEKIGQAFRCLY